MKWLLDEMLPRAAAGALEGLGHDAVSVVGIGMQSASDSAIYQIAVAQGRVVVTEDRADFAQIAAEVLASGSDSVPVVFVNKNRLARGGALAHSLAASLHRWSLENPGPYPGPHWL